MLVQRIFRARMIALRWPIAPLAIMAFVLSLLAACSSADAVVSPPGCQLLDWGPKVVHAGERFNEQPDGYSAFWFRGSCDSPRMMLAFAGQQVNLTVQPDLMTAAMNADGVLATPGSYPVALLDPASDLRTVIGRLRVLPPRRTVVLPPAPAQHWPAASRPVSAPLLIAHAGGAFQGHTYLNSLDALNYNYALGHRVFELDFSLTADNKVVGIHDWKGTWRRLFPDADHHGIPDHADFMQATMLGGQMQIDLPRLRIWLAEHPDAHIVTDVRGNNLLVLRRIKAVLGPHQAQVIPQMYHVHVYPDIRALGYDQIIFTLYSARLELPQLLEFIRATPLYAVTVNPKQYDIAAIIKGLRSTDVPVYVHTFNSTADFDQYRALGVHGLYTDFLYPLPDGGVARQSKDR